MQYISQLNSCAPLLPVNLTVNVRRFYNSVYARIFRVLVVQTKKRHLSIINCDIRLQANIGKELRIEAKRHNTEDLCSHTLAVIFLLKQYSWLILISNKFRLELQLKQNINRISQLEHWAHAHNLYCVLSARLTIASPLALINEQYSERIVAVWVLINSRQTRLPHWQCPRVRTARS